MYRSIRKWSREPGEAVRLSPQRVQSTLQRPDVGLAVERVQLEAGWKQRTEQIGIDDPVEEEQSPPVLAHDPETSRAARRGDSVDTIDTVVACRRGHGALTLS